LSEHTAQVVWSRGEHDFPTGRYSRGHVLRFDGGLEVPGSASPHVVPPPWSDPAALDPEEAFVASLASCHMLWFLSLAAQRGYCVERYADAAVGVLGPDATGRLAILVVTLRPRVELSGPKRPTADELHRLHHEAHERCFIASSVKTEVRCEPPDGPP
jgi:organic hydroperoxide reductase OsmC/OhrA